MGVETGAPVGERDGSGATSASTQARELARIQNLLQVHHDVHELMARDAPLADVLAELVRGVERQSDGMLGSILLFDPPSRTLRHGAAPSLPPTYVAAIDGTAVGPDVGSCGAAAHRGSEVIVGDVRRDARWARFREVATSHGLLACWSAPIRDAAGGVLGTFALYYSEPREPDESELRTIRNAGRLAAIAIERHRALAELRRLATHDALTGLPNRSLLVDRLEQSLRRRGGGAPVAVAFCDLDRFTLVNDSLGHDLGDWVLRAVGERLATVVGVGDTVARYGGDEFVVVAEGVPPAALAERIHAALAAPLVHPSAGEHAVSVTVGLAVAEPDASADEAIARAKRALADAKRAGVPTARHSDATEARATERLRLYVALRGALERGELELHYQPIVELASNRIVAFEALMRWRHAELGMVSPGRFVPIAEETGQIVELGEWALAEAVAHVGAWRAGDPVGVSVNLSTRQLVDPALPERVALALTHGGVDAALLTVEITETALIEDRGAAVRSLRALAELGVRVALDDFGTGWSSFSRLRRLPIDALKIDREFVAGLGRDPDADAIVRAMIGVGDGLGCDVVAEGVERPRQLERLRELGCRHVQGFLLGRPQPAAAALERARRAD